MTPTTLPPPAGITVAITPDGTLRLDRETACRFFPDDVLVALLRGATLLLLPTRGAAAGGLILNTRNRAGDRSVLLAEVFGFHIPAGSYEAVWDESLGGLRVPCDQPLASQTVPPLP